MGVWSLRKLGASLAVALLLVSCTDSGDMCPCRPECDTGIIEGYLLGGDGPLQGTVKAKAAADTTGQSGSITTDADSTGWYHLDLPGGAYVLLVRPKVEGCDFCYYAYTGLATLSGNADTLHMIADEEPLRVDFLFGGLRARVAVPAGLEGQVLHLSIAQEDSILSGRWREVMCRMQATVEQGVAEFACTAFPPGDYAMRLDTWPRTPEEIWLPSVRTPNEADMVTVAAGEMTEYEAVLATSFACMSGEIVGSWQEMGLGRPWVFLFAADSTIVAETETDWLGSFAFNLIIPTHVRVLVAIGRYTRWIGGRGFEDAEEFDLQLGEEISGVRLVESGLLLETPIGSFMDTWCMRAEVLYAEDLTPVWEAGGRLFGRNHLVPIPNLTTGDYIIHLSPAEFLHSAWLSQWYDGAESPEQATVVSIQQDGEVVPLTLHLERGGVIEGTVTWPWGAGFEYVWICATTADSEEHLGAIRLGHPWLSLPEAAFTLRGFPNGDYKIGGWVCDRSDPNCAPATATWYPGTPEWSSAMVIAIRDHEDVSGIEFEIPQGLP